MQFKKLMNKQINIQKQIHKYRELVVSRWEGGGGDRQCS